MSYFHDHNYRPPLPPRSPRPGLATSPGPEFSPFPTPSLSSECGVPSPSYEIPPPLPRRPVGAPPGTSTSTLGGLRSSSAPYLDASSAHGPGYASFPPPPVSPNRPQAQASRQHQKPPPLPPRSPHQVASPFTQAVSRASYAQAQTVTTSNDGPVTPTQITSFPSPPSRPPQHRVTSGGSPVQRDNGGFRSKFPLPPDPPFDPEIPSSPPPAYSVVDEAGSEIQSPGADSLPHAAYSSSEPPMTPGGSGATTPDPSTYMTFPTASFIPPTTAPAIPPQVVVVSPTVSAQRTSSATSSLPSSTNVSNPQSPDAMSFFPTPPLVSPMPVKDPIEELMQSVSLDLKSASEDSTQKSRPVQLQTPASSTEDLAVSPSPSKPVVTPLRPPKKPLDDVPAAVPQLNGGAPGGKPSVSFETARPGAAVLVSRPRLRSHSWKSKAVVTSCIDTPATFSTTWYSHPGTPGFLICSRCYADHISTTKFANLFQGSTLDDGKPRVCRFSIPRFKNHMFPTAVTTSYLQPLIDYMRRRSNIPDCRGGDGILGSTASAANIKWYNTRDNAIPGFLVCEACYEDYVGCTPSLATFFQAHPQGQGPTEVWSCDFALSFIQRQYAADSKNTNPRIGWDNFVVEAKARIGITRCGQGERVRTFGRKWFQPVSGPKDLVVCAACYCDEVIHTGEEPKWTIVPGLTEARDTHIRCALGGQFNIKIAMARAQEKKDFSCFWDAVKKLEWHPPCEEAGVVDTEWWTLPGDPLGFQVCGACYSVVCESLDVANIFTRKTVRHATGKPLRCCFNIAHPRLRNYMPRLLELYFTNNPAALITYAEIYASIPPCCRDEEVKGGSWYGWDDCHICAECYLDFARQHELAEHMPLRNAFKEQGVMCEMYSTRMRQQFVVCSRRFPPDVGELLHSSRHRREIYDQTVPQMKRILRQQNPSLGQQAGESPEKFHGGMRLFKTLEEQWKTVE
ncbi:hypothetical protein PFICI_10630 [Pestalotiopsis fici W106-1]|uniref:Uncharacterized protein n=1 Tax=Pestalotiopsis fici (strain W106-1 / CGMCC3.15140) TaxID=1229662 RepID=W3WXH0_PESFW|nr:uncharacterized protein PFICI_10630 [Pestalotiopsis fici W106-1]ETS78568.1 hypothetical protein PFICI_10630 [Pestalotiopsis fici W106-1]